MSQSRKIRWVLAHEPIELFVRAAKRFSEEVNARAAGQVDIEVLTISDYSRDYNGGKKVSKHDLLDLMETGAIEMSQMYTTWLGERYSKDMHVLDLPFLFRDHGHAARVLDGEIGRCLLNDISANNSNVKGLAFTYSGGFRMIPANTEIQSMRDFEGLAVRSNRSPVAVDTFKAIGAKPVVMELEEVTDAVEKGVIVGGESTYPRFYALNQNEVCEIINDTGHSLFLTSIIVSTKFWDDLDSDLQKVISEAALNAARFERQESVDDIAVVQQRCATDGIKVVTLSDEEIGKFKHAVEPVYAKYRPVFGELIGKIQQA
jgi:TRAP-type C4-dicarboxylate transport system substrate-binding protein